MMTTAPESKHNALIDKLNDLVRDGRPSDFELRGIEKEAKGLAKTDAHSSFILQGILACFRNDIEKSKTMHKKSLQLQDDDMTNLQYASSLCNLGQFPEAIEIYEKIYEYEKGDLTLLAHLIDATISGFNYRRALALLGDWEKLNPKELHYEDKSIRNVVDFLNELEITDDDLMSLQEAYSAVVEDGCTVRGRRVAIREDEGFKWLDIDYFTPAAVSKIFEQNFSFSEKLVSIAASKIIERSVFRFSVYKYAD